MGALFLALKVQLNDYEKLQSDFVGLIAGRWIASQNLHITVSYFGEKYSVSELLEKLPSLIVPIKALKLSALGYFESNKILYAKSESHELALLNALVGEAFSLGQTKPFLPHATLMRVKTVEDETAFREKLKYYENKEIGTVDTSFVLMRSHIKYPGGANYECLESI
jgi:2'-5' RNA ligase